MVSHVPSDVQLEKIILDFDDKQMVSPQNEFSCVSSYFHVGKRFLNIKDKQIVSE